MSTIKDVARRTGLSLSTISKYLNGGNVREENRLAIDAAIEELDYSVNVFARSLKANRSMTIGVLLPTISSPFFGRVVAAKLAAGGVRAIDAKRLPTVRNGMLSMWRFVRFVLGYRRSQKRHPQRVAVETSADRCTHCGRCVKLCPTGAIVAGDELRTDAAKCIRCCACVKGCPVGARSYDSPFAPVLSRNFAQRKRNLTLM